MILVERSFHELRCRFIGLNNASVFCLVFFNYVTSFVVLCTLKFARHWGSNFLRAFFMISYSPSSGSIKQIPRNFLALSSFSFSIAHFCFSLTFRRVGPQSVWCGGRLFSCQSHPETCVSIRWFFIQYGESCETCPRIWQLSISINVPIINIFFSVTFQGGICSFEKVDIFQWNRKWFFSRHVQFD